ncbi:MAG: hypothetical protein GX330_07350 [Bacteroidales bacterium]|nr:hypothetical protein [Bacteroidales bacterium]
MRTKVMGFIFLSMLLNVNVYGQFGFYKKLTGIDVSESFTTVKNRLTKDAKPYGMIMDYREKYISEQSNQFTVYEGVQNPATNNYEWKTTTIRNENDTIVIVVVSIPYWENTNLALNVARGLTAEYGIYAYGDNMSFVFEIGDYKGNVMIDYPYKSHFISYSILLKETPSEKEKRLLKEDKKRQEEEKKKEEKRQEEEKRKKIMEEEKEYVDLLMKLRDIDSTTLNEIVTDVMSEMTPIPMKIQEELLSIIPKHLHGEKLNIGYVEETDYNSSYGTTKEKYIVVTIYQINPIEMLIKKSLLQSLQKNIKITPIGTIKYADWGMFDENMEHIRIDKKTKKIKKIYTTNNYGTIVYYVDGKIYPIDYYLELDEDQIKKALAKIKEMK